MFSFVFNFHGAEYTENIIIIYRDCFSPARWGSHAYGMLTIFTDRDELSRSSNDIIESGQFNDLALR